MKIDRNLLTAVSLVLLVPAVHAGNPKKTYEVPREGLMLSGQLKEGGGRLPALKGIPHELYLVNVKKGSSYVIGVYSMDFEPRIVVLRYATPNKEPIKDDIRQRKPHPPVVLKAAEDGTFNVLVLSGAKTPGAYTLFIRETAETLPLDRVTMAGELLREVPEEGLVVKERLREGLKPLPFLKQDHQTYLIQVQKGASYLIDLASEHFDPGLLVMRMPTDPSIKDEIVQKRTEPRVRLRPVKDGVFRIIVSAFDNKVGDFALDVREIDAKVALKPAEDKEKIHDVPEKALQFQGALAEGVGNIPLVKIIHQGYLVRLQKGRTYILDVPEAQFIANLFVSRDPIDKSIPDELLRLHIEPHVMLTPAQDGVFRVAITSLDGRMGAFTINIREGTDWALVAALAEERWDLEKAEKALQRVFLNQLKDHGPKHWKSSDARRKVERMRSLRKLSDAELGRLKEASSWRGKSFDAFKRGDYQTSVEANTKALAVLEAVLGPDHTDLISVHNTLGVSLIHLGRSGEGKPHFEKALALSQEKLGPEDPLTITSLGNLSSVLAESGNYNEARALQEKVVELCRKVHGTYHDSTATQLGNLGVFLSDQGELGAARLCHEESLAIRTKVLGNGHVLTALSLNNLASVLESMGDYVAARSIYEQALAIRERVLGKEHPDVAAALTGLSSLHGRRGEHEKARELAERSLAIRTKVFGPSHRLVSECLNNLAIIADQLKNPAQARRYYDQALAMDKKLLGENHPTTIATTANLAAHLLEQFQLGEARELAAKVVAFRKETLPNHPSTALAIVHLAKVLDMQGDRAQARAHYQEALEIQRRLLDNTAVAQTERQQLAMTSKARLFLDAFLSQPKDAGVDPAAAYAQVLAWKGTVSLRQRQLRLVRQSPELRALADELQSVCARIGTLSTAGPQANRPGRYRKELDALTQRKEAIELELAGKSGAFRDLQSAGTKAVDKLRTALPHTTALVDFLVYMHGERSPASETGYRAEARLAAFIVRNDQPVVRVELGAWEPMKDHIEAWRKEAKLQHPLQASKSGKENAGTALRRLIWQPLEDHLNGAETVLLAPDSALTMLPFAALPGKDPAKFLLEERMLAVVPLPRLLTEILEKTPIKALPEDPTLLVLGDVDFGASVNQHEVATSRSAPRDRGLSWRPLPGTAGEIRTVGQLFAKQFPKGTAQEMTRAVATEAAVRQEGGKYRWLHFATHGFFAAPTVVPAETKTTAASRATLDREQIVGFHPGVLSGIVLAGANQPPEIGRDDGVLTALEIAELDLRKADLVVLSACETGLGKASPGEGVLGLQRAFQLAGANTVVSSLWAVNDAATQKLMEKFYENLWSRRLSTGEALRQAQLWMMREGPKLGFESPLEAPRELAPPFFWASFVLSGDWR